MVVISASFIINFPKLMNWNYFIIGLAFFAIGFMIEKFVLK